MAQLKLLTNFQPSQLLSSTNSNKSITKYQYFVLEAPLPIVKNRLKQKHDKIVSISSKLDVVQLDSNNEKIVSEFNELFNIISLTSVDPYEKLDENMIREYFSRGSYLVYYHNLPVGYCIVSLDKTSKIAIINGIGIHHRHR